MDDSFKRSVALIELLIATALIGFLIIGISSLDTFTRFHLISLDRRAQIQNEASRVLEHMAKNMTGTDSRGGAIGDTNQLPIDRTNIAGDSAIRIWVDWDSDSRRNNTLDKQIAYRYRGSSSNYEIWYYANYTDSPDTYDIITSNKITSDFSSTYVSYDNTEGDSDPIDNYIDIGLIACWDPDETSDSCGTIENPQVNMEMRIKMPAVSVN